MVTLGELRARKKLLQKGKERRSKILKEQLESRKLKQEIRELKHPRTFAAVRSIRKASSVGLKTLGTGVKATVSEQLKIGADEKRKQLEDMKKKQRSSIRREVLSDIRKKSKKRIVKKRRKKRK